MSLRKVLILEENVRWHLEAFASELFIYIYIYDMFLYISFYYCMIYYRKITEKNEVLTLLLLLSSFYLQLSVAFQLFKYLKHIITPH